MHRDAKSPRLAAAVAAVLALLVSAGCGSPGVTSTRLQDSVGVSFQRLYVLQQRELGHRVPAPDRSAACVRNGSAALTGAGSWTCTVHFPYPDGHVQPLSFDVEVASIGCYTASGPPAVVGQLKLQATNGAAVTNPLFAFDGCFDLQ